MLSSINWKYLKIVGSFAYYSAVFWFKYSAIFLSKMHEGVYYQTYAKKRIAKVKRFSFNQIVDILQAIFDSK